ncbi:MAG TPA: competence/damage-inducible protein A [Acidimicrobiia bacterium]|jgi:nicotinamide-nucleotide amidase|nr:competence/damage-inducible protein A [Acidimicrobiia bacterium]
MIVETLAVGTELLLGQIVNSNAAAIGTRLADSGFDHFHQTVVGDNVARITAAITSAAQRSDALIITGGIGPTQDDLTRDGLCAAAGVEMRFSDEYADRLRRWWERRGRTMPDSNLRQAEYPDGAEMLINRKGTAPGLRMRIGQCWVFAVPGVPAEMIALLEDDILPFLRTEAGEASVVVSRLIRTWGESESRVGEMMSDLFEQSSNPSLAFLASSGEIKLRLTAKAEDVESARALIAPAEEEVRRRMGMLVFGADDETIEAVLFSALGERGWSIATAESATGGLIAARLAGVPGASKHFVGSVVAYDPMVKEAVLGVDAALVREHGVVSEAVALAMASGAATQLDADVVIAVTGAAGPDPLEQRAGTMIIAVQTPEAAHARTFFMPGDRERVRVYTTTAALQLARLAITGAWWGSVPERWSAPQKR